MRIYRNYKESICGKKQTKIELIGIILVVIATIICIGIFDSNKGNNPKKLNEYNITFMNDGARLDNVIVKEGELLQKPQDPTKDGYVFSHWATHEKSIDGSEVYDFTIAPTKSFTLFAHYTKKEDITNQNNSNDSKNNSNNSSSNNNQTNKPNSSTNSKPSTKPSGGTNNNGNNNSSNSSTTTKPNNNTPSVSVSKQNALKSAKEYLNYSAFSRDGLIKQLEFEKFSEEDATYAVDNCGANWNEQALKSAKEYLNYSAFSRDGLIKQLEFEKFTSSQAIYGVENCGANWNEQAVKSAKEYLEYSAFSRDGLIEQLEFEGFTHEQAVYGVTQNGL